MSVVAPEISNPELVAALLAEDPAAIRAALPSARLLVPRVDAGDGRTLINFGRDAQGRRLLWAFTDLEALRAWDRHPAGEAVAFELEPLAELVPAGAGVMMLNAAGPGACGVGGEVLPALIAGTGANGSDPSGNGAGSGAGSTELVAPEARRPIRTIATRAHDRGRRAAAAGMFADARAEFERAIEACSRLGDRLHGAATAIELAACQARDGEPAQALRIWSGAGEALADLGECDLAAAALLDAVRIASELVGEAEPRA
jgi:hypothetical protein